MKKINNEFLISLLYAFCAIIIFVIINISSFYIHE